LFSVSTFGDMPKARRLASEFGLSLELSELASADELDKPGYVPALAAELGARGGEGAARVRSIHGPFMDLVPATIDSALRAVALSRFESAIGACEALGAPKLILHSGWFPRSYPDALWLENSLAFWRKLLARLGPGGRIHIENVYEEDWRLLSSLIDGLGDERVSICLDVGHVSCFSPRDVREWIAGLGLRIGHVHLHNNSGRGDEHRGLAEGRLDMKAVLDELRGSCPRASWNVEVSEGLESSVGFLVDYYGRRGLGADFA
jgi:sugar phosphate isomerase/epimerase